MRWMRYFVVLCVLLPFKAPAQQYSEAVCMLLQQQVDRYANQKNHPNYRSAKSQYDKNCYKVTPKRQLPVKAEPTAPPAPVVNTNKAAKAAIDVANEAVTNTVNADIASSEVVPVAAESNNAQQAEVSSAAANNKDASEDVVKAEEAAAQVTDAGSIALPATTAEPVVKTIAIEPVQNTAEQTDVDLNKLLLEILQATPLVAANIVAFLLVVFLLTNWLGLNLPGFKGVFAEYKLNRLLLWRLSKEYQHFRKLRLTNNNNESTVIDHLVLSPYGIFVIMVKGYRGRITGSESLANWTRDYLGTSKQFMNPLHQNFKNMQALKQLLELPGFELMHSVIAFARVGQFASELPANITYIDTTSNYIKQCTERVINDEQLARFAAVIQQAVNDA